MMRPLINLWLRQTTTAIPPRPGQGQFSGRIVVTFREPMKISGTVLLPGRYVFRLQDLGTDRNVVQIFKEDPTDLVATFTAVPHA
jgi:hypothetical protein